MPSKKRKYEARFPPARIKKIMQTDEEIGKVAAAVPVIISRSLEIFLQSLVETTAQYTNERKAKTMTTGHLKHCIESEGKFDFLKDLVANIADIANEEDEGGEPGDKPKKQRKPRQTNAEKKKKKKESSSEEESDAQSDGDETGSTQRSFPSSPNPSDDVLPDEIPPINIPPIHIPPISISMEPMEPEQSSVVPSNSQNESSSSPRSGQVPDDLQSPHHTQESHVMSPPQPQQQQPQPQPHGMQSPKHAHVIPGMSPQRCAQFAQSHDEVLESSESPLQMSLASSGADNPVVTSRDMKLHMDISPMVSSLVLPPSLHASSSNAQSHPPDAPSPQNAPPCQNAPLVNAPPCQNAPSVNAPPCQNAPSVNAPPCLNAPSVNAPPCLNATSPPNALSPLNASPSLNLTSTNAISSAKSTCANLSLPLNNAPSALSGRSPLNGSPNVSSSQNVQSPLLPSPRNPSSANASSPIYMPNEQRPSIIQSNVADRSELSERPRPARPSHSIDSIMGNIPSAPPSQHQQEEVPTPKPTISSSFMPNFNLHGNGTSVPSISTSFRMNFPSSFKVANDDDDDDYDT